MRTILIADDDPVILKLFEHNLLKSGFNVIKCTEGATVIAQAHLHKPDAVVLDYLLPGRTGLELIADFKADESLASIPLVIVTAQGKTMTKDELMAAGARQVFTKPFSPMLLVSALEDFMKN
ncbi:MAG TPA: response regulator [Opitutales bacterium]|nr:response regulator [Opitutales bacterium]